MTRIKDYKYGAVVAAQIRIIYGVYEIRMPNRLKQYDSFEHLPIQIRKPLSLLLIDPNNIEHIEGVGRVMGGGAFWIYKPTKEK
jgi:hypothetical protein